MFYSDRNIVVLVCVCVCVEGWNVSMVVASLTCTKRSFRALGNDPLSENTYTLVLLYHHWQSHWSRQTDRQREGESFIPVCTSIILISVCWRQLMQCLEEYNQNKNNANKYGQNLTVFSITCVIGLWTAHITFICGNKLHRNQMWLQCEQSEFMWFFFFIPILDIHLNYIKQLHKIIYKLHDMNHYTEK